MGKIRLLSLLTHISLHKGTFSPIRGNISLLLLIFSFLFCGYMIVVKCGYIYVVIYIYWLFICLLIPTIFSSIFGFFWGEKMIFHHTIKYNHNLKIAIALYKHYWMGKIVLWYSLTFPPSLYVNSFCLTYVCVYRLYLSRYMLNNYKFWQQKWNMQISHRIMAWSTLWIYL